MTPFGINFSYFPITDPKILIHITMNATVGVWPECNPPEADGLSAGPETLGTVTAL